jgi:hypothetical protein
MRFLVLFALLACSVSYSYAVSLEIAKQNPLKAYVLTQFENKQVKDSGVRLGPLDLKFETVQSLKDYGLPNELVEKMTPFIGKSGIEAQRILQQKPLQVTQEQFQMIEKKLVNYWKPKVEKAPQRVRQDPVAMKLARLAMQQQWPELLQAINVARQTLKNLPL